MYPTDIAIHNGNNQLIGSAETVTQNNYYAQPGASSELAAPRHVVILGAGVDAALGLPASNSLIPRIADWLKTDEGTVIDKALRGKLKRLTFSYDTLIDKKINKLISDLDDVREVICRNIRQEIDHNGQVDEQGRKLGRVIVCILQKITDMKNNAVIDEETEQLIQELFGIELADQSIIDTSKLNYTQTFEAIIKEILKKSMGNADDPVLRHIYKNILDIEKLLAENFYGFYTGKETQIKTYLYIAWTLWAFLVHEEQAAIDRNLQSGGTLPVYGQLEGRNGIQLICFNYTGFAACCSSTALYFNGNLTDYVDIETKNERQVEEIPTLDLADFFQNRLSVEMAFEGECRNIPVPLFMPPLMLKPVISKRYITTWYKTGEAIRHAEKILILGHSLQTADGFFGDLLRDNREARIAIVNRDLDATCRNLCALFQQSPQCSRLIVQGHEARMYNNRITVVGADLKDIDLGEWIE